MKLPVIITNFPGGMYYVKNKKSGLIVPSLNVSTLKKAIDEVMPYTDLFMVSLKHFNNKMQQDLTGKKNEEILKNIKLSKKYGIFLQQMYCYKFNLYNEFFIHLIGEAYYFCTPIMTILTYFCNQYSRPPSIKNSKIICKFHSMIK